MVVVVRDRGEEATFVLEEIAHPRPAGQHKLSHILDDLGLLLRRESGEPLGETLREKLGQSGGFLKSVGETGWVTRGSLYVPLCPAWTGG